MKVLALVLSAVLAAQAVNLDQSWAKFKSTHGKTYESLEHEAHHLETYKSNLKRIAEHNKKYDAGEVTWFMAENQFTDMTFEEFSEYNKLATFVPPKLPNVTQFPVRDDAPGSFDWRDRGGMNDVKNQGGCGSCWAFATIASLESRYFVVRGQEHISLSEQQLVDCSRGYGAGGCNGGWMTEGYDYIRDNDINRDSDYPYEAADRDCRADGSKNVNVHVTGYYQTANDDEESLRQAVYWHGAIAVAIDVTDNFQHYGGGVFNDDTCSKDTLNHGVTVTGYGNDNGNDFWAVRNSWAASWGEAGYIRMSRNRGGQCGIALYGYSPDMS